MGLKIFWSDRLENLAETMYRAAVKSGDPFDTECVVVGSRLMASWLKQFFLYDLDNEAKRNRVFAGWDFLMIHPFVNDWLAKAVAGVEVGERDPSLHPYSMDVLQWRIWNLLSADTHPESYARLSNYIAGRGNRQADSDALALRKFGLSARLAKLFDDYQNYRPDVLAAWQNNDNRALNAGELWQADLWRELVEDESRTYASQFFKCNSELLKKSGVPKAYTRVSVFNVTAMPQAYLRFFEQLSQIMRVDMYVFNPSQEFWLEDVSVKKGIEGLMQSNEERKLKWMELPHPLLSGFGQGTQSFLANVLEISQGNVNDAQWGKNRKGALLFSLQNHIRGKKSKSLGKVADDGSIQVHVCHSAQREIEVIKDLVLKWFDENPGAQPRDVQVLVPDMDTYAPFIESVFRVNDFKSGIPAVITQRPAISAGVIGAAFLKLVSINEKRMAAGDVMELLELEPIRECYGLVPEDLGRIRDMIDSAGIRWGRDKEHIERVLGGGSKFPDTVTWSRGFGRLLTGYAFGRSDVHGENVKPEEIETGGLGVMMPDDRVEGDTAELLGKLGTFYDDLSETANRIDEADDTVCWPDFYIERLEKFFKSTESSFMELAEIRRGILAVKKSLAAAGNPGISAKVMTAALAEHLGALLPAGATETNSVLFSPMQTMQVTPRKLIIMAGLNDAVFPRVDKRPAFDLLAIRPRYGDKSMRHEDRLAFLEGIMAARERLIITYTGRNIANNKEIPPSPAVTELLQFMANHKSKDSVGDSVVTPVIHKLHGFNPEYYDKNGKLFSYSASNYKAALAIEEGDSQEESDDEKDSASLQQVPTVGEEIKIVRLEDLQEFFINPARWFYRNILQIWIRDPARDVLSASEMFDLNSLDQYKFNGAVIDYIISEHVAGTEGNQHSCEMLHKILQEKSLSPLGSFGHGYTLETYTNLRSFLEKTLVYVPDVSLLSALLRKSLDFKNHPVSITCDEYKIVGEIPVLSSRSKERPRDFSLHFRYATIGNRDLIRAWIAHVAGHAQGLSFYTDIFGKPDEKGEEGSKTLQPMNAEKAKEELRGIIKMFQEGQNGVIPFALESSRIFAEKIKEGESSSEAERSAIVDAWEHYVFPEGEDPYLKSAWGEEGIVSDEKFRLFAQTFWGGYLDLTGGTQGDASTPNSETGSAGGANE